MMGYITIKPLRLNIITENETTDSATVNDETKDWATYNSTTFQLTLKYPKSANLSKSEESKDAGGTSTLRFDISKTYPASTLQISFGSEVEKEQIKGFFNNHSFTEENTTIGGKPTWLVKGNLQMANGLDYYAEYLLINGGNSFYEFFWWDNTDQPYTEDFQKLLKTVKFTDQSNSTNPTENLDVDGFVKNFETLHQSRKALEVLALFTPSSN